MTNSVKTTKGTELPLMQLQGKFYMQVQWRVVWFKEEKPTWSIETELLRADEAVAMFKAIVKDESGRVISSAHGSETYKNFPAGHVEKAETVAIGRALANCGYGTAFAAELSDGDSGKIADSPIQKSNTFAQRQAPQLTNNQLGNFKK
jgi:hypothetical protein